MPSPPWRFTSTSNTPPKPPPPVMKKTIRNRLTTGLRRNSGSPKPGSISSADNSRPGTPSAAIQIPRSESPAPAEGSDLAASAPRSSLRGSLVELANTGTAVASSTPTPSIAPPPSITSPEAPTQTTEPTELAEPTEPTKPTKPTESAEPIQADETSDAPKPVEPTPADAAPSAAEVRFSEASLVHPVPLSRSSTFNSTRPLSSQYRFLDASNIKNEGDQGSVDTTNPAGASNVDVSSVRVEAPTSPGYLVDLDDPMSQAPSFPQPQPAPAPLAVDITKRQPSHASLGTNPFEDSKFEIREVSPSAPEVQRTSVYIPRHDVDINPSLMDQEFPADDENRLPPEISPMLNSMPIPALHEVIPRQVPLIYSPPSTHDLPNILDVIPTPSNYLGTLSSQKPQHHRDETTHMELKTVASNRSMLRSDSEQNFRMSAAGPVSSRAEVEPERRSSERQPLLDRGFGRMDTREVDSIVNSMWPIPRRQLDPISLGWVEYALPDSSFYYFHGLTRCVTDVDLRDPRKLDAVTGYIDRIIEEAPGPDWDCWLRDVSALKDQFEPWTLWAQHSSKVITDVGPNRPHDELSEVDKIKSEVDYWTYIQSHPSHVDISSTAYASAMDTLTWSYSDNVFSSGGSRTTIPPFSKTESQDLIGLLKTLDRPTGINSSLLPLNRVIAKVMIRSAGWKLQKLGVSLNSASPGKITTKDMKRSPRPFQNTIRHFIMAVVCLGIPYMRTTTSRDGEGSGSVYSRVGSCLVGALLLTSSITFLAAPGLDKATRIAILVSALFSAGGILAVLLGGGTTGSSSEEDMKVDRESQLIRSRLGIRSSIPLVLLAYATCSLVVAIILYALKGLGGTGDGFDEVTKWIVVGTWVLLLVVLVTSLLLTKRP